VALAEFGRCDSVEFLAQTARRHSPHGAIAGPGLVKHYLALLVPTPLLVEVASHSALNLLLGDEGRVGSSLPGGRVAVRPDSLTRPRVHIILEAAALYVRGVLASVGPLRIGDLPVRPHHHLSFVSHYLLLGGLGGLRGRPHRA